MRMVIEFPAYIYVTSNTRLGACRCYMAYWKGLEIEGSRRRKLASDRRILLQEQNSVRGHLIFLRWLAVAHGGEGHHHPLARALHVGVLRLRRTRTEIKVGHA